MLTDVVTLFPAEIEVGDSVFDPTSHLWHEVAGVASGGGILHLVTTQGDELDVPASDRRDVRPSDAHHDVVLEHARPRDDVDAVVARFWD